MYDTATADCASSILHFREDRGVDLRANFAANGLADLVGYTVTLKLGTEAEVSLPISGNSFSMQLDTTSMAPHTPYVIYWTTPAAVKDALFRGTITVL